MKIIFLGPPASGKGVQTKILSDSLNIPRISSGEIIRQVIESNGDNASYFKSRIETGHFIPDPKLISLLTNYLSVMKFDDFIADGFPRTYNQTRLLFSKAVLSQQDCLIHLNVNEDALFNRLNSRMKLENRPDDDLNIFKTRLSLYYKYHKAVQSCFDNSFEIDANGNISKVAEKISHVIKKHLTDL
eukprot:COSAG01_NODE_1_length_100484_cov_170.446142_71_plen_187_part_00